MGGVPSEPAGGGQRTAAPGRTATERFAWDAVRVSVCIQHAPSRDSDPVYQELREALPEAVVVTDPGGSGVRDNPEGADFAATWRCYRECLRHTPPSATHRLILQDDVRVCRDFLAGVALAVKARPDNLLSFFISMAPQRSAIAHIQACERGETWSVLDSREWTPTQALCWPHYLIAPMLRHEEATGYRGPWRADDECVGRFSRERGIRALQSCPSLVEHVYHSQGSSIGTGNRGPHRAAACLIGDYSPARDVDWSTGALG